MLEGRLVRLRAHDPSDLEPSLRWINDPEVTRTLAARYPMSRPQEEEWLERVSRQTASSGDVSFAIDTLDGRHIGSCGLHRISWENRTAALGILIGEKDCWDQGYGTDAVRTLVRFAFREMNLQRVELDVFEFNPRAVACYRKCGFVEEGRRRGAYYSGGRYHDILMMGILREEFDALDAAGGA